MSAPSAPQGGGEVAIASDEDMHTLFRLRESLEDLKIRRWKGKNWDLDDCYVNANIGHAAQAAEWALPALNRVLGVLVDNAHHRADLAFQPRADAAQQSNEGAVKDDSGFTATDAAQQLPADAQAWAEYSIDADPAGIRARAADAITGALAFGAQGTNKPPAGHWLEPFWDMARAEAQTHDGGEAVAWVHPQCVSDLERAPEGAWLRVFTRGANTPPDGWRPLIYGDTATPSAPVGVEGLPQPFGYIEPRHDLSGYEVLDEPGPRRAAIWNLHGMQQALAQQPAAVDGHITIEPGERLFQFDSRQHWINGASRIWRFYGVRAEDTVCVDALGRLVNIGKHFADAERDGAYPIAVYRLRADMNPDALAGQQQESES